MSLSCRRQLVSALSRVLPSSRFSRTVALFSLLGVTSSLSLGHTHLDEVSAKAADSGSETSIQDQKQDLESLTQALLVFSMSADSRRSFSVGGFAQQSQSMSDSVTIAAARQQLLSSLIETHPEEVLRAAIPASIRESLPSEVQSYVEKEVTIEGNFTIMCDESRPENCLRYFLDTKDTQLSLHFAAGFPENLETGSYVHARGVQVGEALALASDGATLMSAAATLLNATGEQRVLVLLVNFQDKPTERPYTVEYARSVVFDKADQFFRENSQGQTWLTGDVYGWYTIALNSTNCSSSQISSLAQQAARNAGVNLAAYNRYVYASPRGSCPWGGLGTIGGAPSQAWINESNPPAKLFAHELGHNLGLYHSNALECGATTIGEGCSTIEYGDAVDTMGTGGGHYNVFQKERLGWLPDSIAEVSADGVYILAPHEKPAGVTPQILKIKKDTSGQNWYYVEYRQPIGFDSFLSIDLFANVRGGLVIHTGSSTDANSSKLLDMTPETSSWFDPALSVGRSFTDPTAGVNISPLWANGTTAAVQVSSSPAACTRSDPIVTVSPSASQWVPAGTAVNYTISITNKDSANCSTSGFDLQAAVPSGWSIVSPASVLNIGPGNSMSTTLQVTSPTSAADGFYTVTTKAIRSTAPASEDSISATYVVASGLNVAVTTDQPSYPQREWVTLTVNVGFASSPVKGAKVTFTITKPNGKVLKKTLTTGQDGRTSFRFRLQAQDPTGNYTVTTAASLKNVIPGEATTSFTVY